MVPWARRVDGVLGTDPTFFNQTLVFPSQEYESAVFRWRARNHINGLMYGNGGLSSWTKSFVQNMRTHEATDGRTETEVEFCFDPLYWPMYDCYSNTYPNGSPFQAWRAGFREGVKMCLQRGRKPSVEEFKTQVLRNLDNLTIWHNVGSDVENGEWAMAGARQGTYMTMLTNWNYRLVQDFNALAELWLTVKDSDPRLLSNRLSPELGTQLDLPMAILESEQSAFFKYHYRSNWHNQGIMTREIDVIRKQEGW